MNKHRHIPNSGHDQLVIPEYKTRGECQYMEERHQCQTRHRPQASKIKQKKLLENESPPHLVPDPRKPRIPTTRLDNKP